MTLDVLIALLIDRWTERAIQSRIEAHRIHKTIKDRTTAEERCYIRAEVWEECACELKSLLEK